MEQSTMWPVHGHIAELKETAPTNTLFGLNVLDPHRRRAINGNIRHNLAVLHDLNNSSAA